MLRKPDFFWQRRQSCSVSTEPELSRKAAAVLSLYLNPPRNALRGRVD